MLGGLGMAVPRNGEATMLALRSMVLAAALTALALPAAAQEKVTFASPLPFYPGVAEGYGVTKYAEALEGLFKHHPAFAGKVEYVAYDRGALFANIAEHLEAVSTNAIQITYSVSQEMEALEPAYKVATAPGLFRDFGHFARAMDSDAWQAVEERLASEKGVKVLGWVFDAGALYLFTRSPVASMADMQGQRIRYPAGEAWRLAIAGLGAEPLALPYTEVVPALQTNLIDGLITDFTGGVSYYGLAAFTPNAVLIPVSIQPIAMVASADWWASLADDQKAAIEELFAVVDTSLFYAALTDVEIEKWRQASLTAEVPADADAWRQAMQSSAESTIADVDPLLIQTIRDSQ